MKTYSKLIIICLLALILRVGLVISVEHPGIADPNHYYNLGQQLVGGNGFQIDYIWQYYNPPDSIIHPDDFWMPLTGVLAAGGMTLFGTNVHAAILPFILIGSLLPIISFLAARQLGLSESAGLQSAAYTAVLPELLLNSLRTNTPVPNAFLLSSALLLLTYGLKRNKIAAFVGCGILAGLAYLTRSETMLLIPVVIATLLLYTVLIRRISATRAVLYGTIILVAMLVVVSPWLIRNIRETGSLTTPHLSRMFFMTDVRDFYSYGRDLNWSTLQASQSIGQIIGKRLFEMAASIKMMYIALEEVLPVAIVGGFIGLAASRDRERFLVLAPTLLLLLVLYLFYTILAPYNNQGGAFKKSYLSLLPLLIPVGAYAIERAINDVRIRRIVIVLTVGMMVGDAIEMMRADIRFTNSYLEEMERVVQVVNDLPDTNDDGQIILMAQDQFMLRFLGIRSVMVPMEDRDTVLEVARRYKVDYLMMPPARPSLDSIYERTETDPRYVYVRKVQGTSVEIYGFASAEQE